MIDDLNDLWKTSSGGICLPPNHGTINPNADEEVNLHPHSVKNYLTNIIFLTASKLPAWIL